MASIIMTFKVPRTDMRRVHDMLEADATPTCTVLIRNANKGMHEVEIKTDHTNAAYFREALQKDEP